MSRFSGCARIVFVSALSVFAVVTISVETCGSHTSDSKMISFFHRHESSFERLVTMAHEDTGIEAVTRESVMLKNGENNWVVAPPHVMQPSRWNEYQRLFRELKLPGGVAKDGQDVDFRIDNYSILNGDACKGLYYSLKSLPSCSAELSKCLSSKGDGSNGRTVNKLIKPHWYLYLHYN